MKRIFALSLSACLLAAVSAPAHAASVKSVYGPPPPAALTVTQIPRAGDDDVLTPLPSDSALPPDPAKKSGLPPVAGAMPVGKVEIGALTAAEKKPAFAESMPPAPAPIRNAAPEPLPVRTAALGKPANPPKAAPGMNSSLPFPPSAAEWADRMPLGNAATVADVVPPPATVRDDTAQPSQPVVHRRPLPDAQSAQGPGDDGDLSPVRPLHINPAVRDARADDGGEDEFEAARPRHVVVSAGAEACRGYTRTLADGRRTAGTACRGGDGVWRIAEEHLTVRYHALPARVSAAPPVRYSSPGPALDTAYTAARMSMGLAGFWHWPRM